MLWWNAIAGVAYFDHKFIPSARIPADSDALPGRCVTDCVNQEIAYGTPEQNGIGDQITACVNV